MLLLASAAGDDLYHIEEISIIRLLMLLVLLVTFLVSFHTPPFFNSRKRTAPHSHIEHVPV